MSHPDDELSAHRDFLNRYYGASRRIYDLTRKYYLFGRDGVLGALAGERWTRLVEVGPGTGRNLRLLRRMRPDAELGAIEASDAMLEHARARCPDVSFVQGFAERADYAAPLGAPPERVLFSYCLSMVPNQREALARARGALAPGGEVVVVDFSDLEGLPGPLAALLRAWLRAFHVAPLDDALLEEFGATLTHGPLRYYVVGRIGA
jgi:S-adenosylmethionine-diacylgycerolhomoserine-N-methlytransferase